MKEQGNHKMVMEPRKMAKELRTMVRELRKKTREPHSLGFECHNLMMGLHMMSWEIRMMLREPCKIHLGELVPNLVCKRTLASFVASACNEVSVCKQVWAYKMAFWVCMLA